MSINELRLAQKFAIDTAKKARRTASGEMLAVRLPEPSDPGTDTNKQ